MYASIPSLCGMLVYSEETLKPTRMLFRGISVVVISLINFVESFM